MGALVTESLPGVRHFVHVGSAETRSLRERVYFFKKQNLPGCVLHRETTAAELAFVAADGLHAQSLAVKLLRPLQIGHFHRQMADVLVLNHDDLRYRRTQNSSVLPSGSQTLMVRSNGMASGYRIGPSCGILC